MEVSALKYSGGIGLHGRSPLLRLQSDERLVGLVRRGNSAAFEALVSRYESRLLSFCRHLLGSREDAEDVLQEVLAAAFNAMIADNRPINVRPWLYRIARNRSLNHLRRIQAVGIDSMDVHYSDHGASTADKVHDREEFRLLVGDINELPETQRTALVLREMDALSYEQIAEAMETTVPSVKSLLVRARVSLAEAAQARLLSCGEVRTELGEVAEGLRRKPSPLVRRHLRACDRCATFRVQLKETNKALAAVLPIGPIVLLKKFVLTHVGHSAGSSAAAGSGAGAAGSTAGVGSTAAAGSSIMAGSSAAGGFVSAGLGAIATKAAAGLAAAALVTAGAVEVGHVGSNTRPRSALREALVVAAPPIHATSRPTTLLLRASDRSRATGVKKVALVKPAPAKTTPAKTTPAKTPLPGAVNKPVVKPVVKPVAAPIAPHTPPPAAPPGRTAVQNDPTVLTSTQPSTPPGSSTPSATQPPTGSSGSGSGSSTPPAGSSGAPPPAGSSGAPPPAGSGDASGPGAPASSGAGSGTRPTP